VDIYSRDDEAAFQYMLQKYFLEKLHSMFEILEQSNVLASYQSASQNPKIIGNPSSAPPFSESHRTERVRHSHRALLAPEGASPETLDLVSDDDDPPLDPANPRINRLLCSSCMLDLSLDWRMEGIPYDPPKKPRYRSHSPDRRNLKRRAEVSFICQSV
jgi:hypothetical protein